MIFSKKLIFLFLISLYLLDVPVFSASKKKTTKKTKGKTETVSDSSNNNQNYTDTDGKSVQLPSQKRTFFFKIDPSIVDDVENGSPESLRRAMTKIRKNESEYDETEKILIAVATQIMKTAWPSESISWDSFPVTMDNPYLGAIESAKKGIFDTSTGNNDFLTTILPAIILLEPTLNSSMFADCEKAISEALKINDKSVFANYLNGVLLEKTNRYSQAVDAYKYVYNNTKDNRESSLAYVRMLQKNGQLTEANKIVDKLNATDPNNVEILKQNAYVAFAEKDYTKAEQYVARVLQQTPNNLEFVLFRAKILIEKNDYIHAVSLLDVYARQDDSSIDYLLLRAKVQLDWSKNTTAATETVEKALQLYPDNPDALMIAARISSATDSPVAGQYADDLAAKVLEKNPDNQDALTYALEGLTQRQNWEEAYKVSKKLIKNESVSTEVMAKYVSICIKTGKKSEAFEYAKLMHDKFPEDEVVLQSYILAYSTNGSREEVRKYIDSLMTNASPKMKSYLFYRRSYLQLTEDASLADLRSSLISNPRNSDALFRLYEVYYAKEDYRKAQYYLRQVVAINPNDSSVKKLNEALTQLIK